MLWEPLHTSTSSRFERLCYSSSFHRRTSSMRGLSHTVKYLGRQCVAAKSAVSLVDVGRHTRVDGHGANGESHGKQGELHGVLG